MRTRRETRFVSLCALLTLPALRPLSATLVQTALPGFTEDITGGDDVTVTTTNGDLRGKLRTTNVSVGKRVPDL